MACSRFASLPADRRSEIPSGLTTATPAESYPRYSIRRSPSIRTGTTGFEPMYPMIPHIKSVPGLRLLSFGLRLLALDLRLLSFDPSFDVGLPTARDSQRAVGHIFGNR